MYVLKNLSCCLEWVFLPPAVTSWPWAPSCCLRGPLMENLCVCLAFCSVRWRARLVVGEGGDSSILETSCRLGAVIFLTQQAPVSVQGWSTCYLAPVDPLFPSSFLLRCVPSQTTAILGPYSLPLPLLWSLLEWQSPPLLLISSLKTDQRMA